MDYVHHSLEETLKNMLINSQWPEKMEDREILGEWTEQLHAECLRPNTQMRLSPTVSVSLPCFLLFVSN